MNFSHFHKSKQVVKLIYVWTFNLCSPVFDNALFIIMKITQSSSFPLAFPVIWGRRYGCRSSLSSKTCLLHRPLSVLQSACPSCTHPSTLSLVSLSSFSPVSLSSSLSSLRDLLPSSWRAHTISVFSPLSFWTPALLSSFLECVRSWFCLFLSLHTSTSASSSRSPQSLIPVVW